MSLFTFSRQLLVKLLILLNIILTGANRAANIFPNLNLIQQIVVHTLMAKSMLAVGYNPYIFRRVCLEAELAEVMGAPVSD
jgi:hypothetical protein